MHPLIVHIRRFVPLSDAEALRVTDALETVTIKKKAHLLEPGQSCRANHFIVKGCFRLYMVDENGSEQTVQFGIENWWITDYTGLESGRPATFYLQAIETSEVALLKKSAQEDLFAEIPALERYFRLIVQRAYAASLNRIQYLFSMSGEERYRHMSAALPEFVQRVPQYMLASYLGFTPEFLSKIRAGK